MKKDILNVAGIIKQLENIESSKEARKGHFKIDTPFEETMKKILKAKPEPKKGKKKR